MVWYGKWFLTFLVQFGDVASRNHQMSEFDKKRLLWAQVYFYSSKIKYVYIVMTFWKNFREWNLLAFLFCENWLVKLQKENESDVGEKFCLRVHDTTALKYGSYCLDLFPRLLFLHVMLFVLNDLSCGFVPLFSKYLFWSGEIPPLCVHALSSRAKK